MIDHLKLIELDSKVPVRAIRSDNGTEFKNQLLNDFCSDKGISRQYSSPITPQQNGVVERKNRTLIEAARTMPSESRLPMYFWAESVNIACYTQNRNPINKDLMKTPYEAVFVGYLRRSYMVYIIGQHQVKESANVTFDDTKLPNIQTEDASEKLKFNNLSDPDSDDEDTQPEIVAETNDNNYGDHDESGGNIDLNGESTNTSEESS